MNLPVPTENASIFQTTSKSVQYHLDFGAPQKLKPYKPPSFSVINSSFTNGHPLSKTRFFTKKLNSESSETLIALAFVENPPHINCICHTIIL